jgi:uncharacterized protein YjcR
MSVKNLIEKIEGRPIKEILHDKYIDKDMTIQEIADELGVSVGIVHKWLKENGINKHKNLWTNFEHFG